MNKDFEKILRGALSDDNDKKNTACAWDAMRQIVVVCFGTPLISGDALGPEVGTLLRDTMNLPAFVYGTDERPLTAKTLANDVVFLRAVHKDAVFVAVDASLGSKEKVGKLVMRGDGVCPAAAGGAKTRFGDVGMLSVVAEGAKGDFDALFAVNRVDVTQSALKIAFVIANAIEQLAKTG